MAIDGRLAEAYVALGTVSGLLERDWAAAEQSFRAAIKMNPHLAMAHHWFAIDCLMPLGRLDEALQVIQVALDRDPTSVAINTHLGLLFHMRREYDRAVRQFQLALDLEPDFFRAHWGLGHSYLQKGLLDEAVACFGRTQTLSDYRCFRMGALGYCYARMGERDKALTVLSDLERAALTSYISPYNFVEIHMGFGDFDAALDWLQRADADRSRRVNWVKIDPILDQLRNDARFLKIVASTGLAKEPAADTAGAV
ncbi:MAG: tetratricopeptide repeat protein [bacterium]